MRHTRLAAALLLLTYLPGCSTYGVMSDPAAELQTAPTPVMDARVILRTGERYNIRSPRIDGDTLRGFSEKGPAVSFPVANISWLEAQQPSGIRTAALVAGVVVTVVAVAYFVSAVVIMDDIVTTCFGACQP